MKVSSKIIIRGKEYKVIHEGDIKISVFDVVSKVVAPVSKVKDVGNKRIICELAFTNDQVYVEIVSSRRIK